MKPTKLLSILLASLSSTVVNAEALSVTLTQDNVQLNYSQPARLETVLKDSITHSQNAPVQRFTIGNQLFNLAKQTQADELKKNTLNSLSTLSNSSDQATRQFALQLMAQIETWKVGYRELLKLDYDWVRITPSANPMLTGEFELISATRPNSIELVGMFESPSRAEFNAETSIADIISQAGALADGHNSYVWAVYPDDHVQRIGYAYWNYESGSLTPGTTLYLGANSDSQQIQQLEQDIIQLITMRRGVK